jgi:hypothetical protein
VEKRKLLEWNCFSIFGKESKKKGTILSYSYCLFISNTTLPSFESAKAEARHRSLKRVYPQETNLHCLALFSSFDVVFSSSRKLAVTSTISLCMASNEMVRLPSGKGYIWSS